jgi:hypothetical protein
MKSLLKTLCFVLLAALTIAASPVSAQGTIPLAMAQQIDINGQPLAGCLLYSYVAGTVATPQNAFADFGLTAALPNPVQCDATGRVPMIWYANGLIHVRLTDSSGVVIIDTTMQVLGPSAGGGGGGGTVDATAILATGDLKARYGTGPLAGFVRANGLTIGSATSGATERANADTQSLWIYLYGADPNLVVSGGRTGNALTDFNANKTITLPDWRGRALAFLDDMGNTAAGNLTVTYLGTAATVLGAAGGKQNMPGLAATNMAPYTATGSVSVNNGATQFVSITGGALSTGGAGTSANPGFIPNFVTSGNLGASNTGVSASFSGNNNGGHSTPFSILPPIKLATAYLKL